MYRLVTAVLLITMVPLSLGSAQRLADSGTEGARQSLFRDVGIAQAYAAKCPGCGHLYTGETLKGGILLAIGGASLIAAPFSIRAKETETCYDTEYGYGCEGGAKLDWKPFLALVGVAAATYIYGMADAKPSADRMNARNGFNSAHSGRLSPMITRSDEFTRVGLRLSLGW